MRKNKWSLFLIVSYILIAACYTLYSFSQIDLNLTLSSNGIYQSFQKVLIRLGYFNRPLSTLFYILIVFLFFTVYSLLFISFKKKRFSLKKLWWLVGLTIGFLIISYPALSHDIFNYMFNAKMVLLYRRNPHIYVALNFPHDTWVRFMHNVHTPAPYFYGWTVLSLIPSVISLNKIIPNIINFKLFEIPFFVWQIYLLNKILGKLIPEERLERLFLFVLNPLVLIEVFGNGHNDLTMTSLALGSLWFLIKEEKISIKNFLLSIFFLLLSASIKYVTIILLPVYLIYAYIRMRYSSSDPDLVGRVEKYRNIFYSRLVRQLADFARTIINDIGGCAAIILFLAIFTRPQDQFQPWYLIWSLSFAIFARNKWILNILLFFSFSLMLRYAPLLYFGEFKKPVMEYRTIITYAIPTILLLIGILKNKCKSHKIFIIAPAKTVELAPRMKQVR